MAGEPLVLEGLSNRHYGLTRAVGDTYSEAAGVCLSRHHRAPVDFTVQVDGKASTNSVQWLAPDERTRNAWANDTDATEAGAYAMSLAAIETREQLLAIRRAETLSGSDYYVAPVGTDPSNLENSWRLEVSGTDTGTHTTLNGRLNQKKKQAKEGNSNIPAIAAVVGFKIMAISIARVSEA